MSLKWNLNREISKLNYKIQTNAIKESLVPPCLTSKQIACKYASETELLNTVLFGTDEDTLGLNLDVTTEEPGLTFYEKVREYEMLN